MRAFRIEMGRGLRRHVTEATDTRDVRFTETAMITEVIVAREKGNTSSECETVKCEQLSDLAGVWLGEEILGQSATRIRSPICRPGLQDGMGDCSSGEGERAKGEVWGLNS